MNNVKVERSVNRMITCKTIPVDTYIEGYEAYPVWSEELGWYHVPKAVKGWIDSVYVENGEVAYYVTQADDKFQGHRGTHIRPSLGDITILEEQKERILFH